MGIKVRVGELLLPRRMREEVLKLLANEAAPVLGEFLVKQIAYTHDVQGRSEDDRHGIWPPRKVPSSGIVVFSKRGALVNAIKRMLKKRVIELSGTYRIEQQVIDATKHGGTMTGVGRYGKTGTFTHRQLLGAALALSREKKNKEVMKARKREIQEEFAKGEHASAEKIAELQQLLKSTPRPITSLRSSRDSMKYRPRPVLFVTGTLRDSWSWKVVQEANRVVLYIGTATEYAAVHYFGSVKQNIPVRKEFVITNNDRAMIAELFSDVMGREFGK